MQLMDNSGHRFSPEANFPFCSVLRLTLPSFLQHWLANPFPLALFSHLFGLEHCSIDRTDSFAQEVWLPQASGLAEPCSLCPWFPGHTRRCGLKRSFSRSA